MLGSDDVLEALAQKQYTSLKENLKESNVADVAELLDQLPRVESLEIFRLLPKDMAADVFSYLGMDTQQKIIESLSDKDSAAIIDLLYADDAADLLEEMPSNIAKRILEKTSDETKEYVDKLLKYPKESAGSLMTVEYVTLRESMTIIQAIEHIRLTGADNETINVCYVLTQTRELVGVISLREIIMSPLDAIVRDVMEKNPITVFTMDDQEDVAEVFQKYDYSTLPVVDLEGHMVGIITVDDIIDVMEQEATEDMQKMAAVIPDNKPYTSSGVFEQVRKRIPWLLLLMLSATFTGAIITSFEDKLAACIILTAYIPMLMDSGGNAGGQSCTTIIRALSLGEIKLKDTFYVIWKEIRIAVCCGVIMACINFVKMQIIDRVTVMVALVVSITLIVAIVCAKIVGSVLPMLAKTIGIDPAVMANPVITTIVDAISLLVYFNIATAFQMFG